MKHLRTKTMSSQNDPAFDQFVDDCLLDGDILCNYNELDLIASNIHRGIWDVKVEEKTSEIPELLLLKQLQFDWDSGSDDNINAA